jgi:hypothetical protein
MRNLQRAPGQGTQIELGGSSAFTKYKCSRCAIQYEIKTGSSPDCPLCTQEIKTEQMRRSLKEATRKIELMEERIRQLESRDEIRSALREALELVEDEDLAFLKGVLYRWRHDKSIDLKVTKGRTGKANGFIAVPRHGKPEGRTCSSIGGVAVAALYEEALRTVGTAEAMKTLMKAAQHLLPGGIT